MPENKMRKSTKTVKPSGLTPLLIAKCGLSLADKTSVSEVSIRKIADELGVTPMAIYRHYSDKEALLSAMLDQFILQADVLPKQPLSWQQWLVYVGMAMYEALCKAPSWIPLFGQLQLKPGALAVMDAYLAVMCEAGFTRLQAVNGFLGLLQNLIGASTMHSAFSNMNNAKNALADFDAISYPQVAQALPDLLSAVSSNLMQNGLRLLVDGLVLELQK